MGSLFCFVMMAPTQEFLTPKFTFSVKKPLGFLKYFIRVHNISENVFRHRKIYPVITTFSVWIIIIPFIINVVINHLSVRNIKFEIIQAVT